MAYPAWNPLKLVPFNLKLNWLFYGIGLFHFGSVNEELHHFKIDLINYSEIYGGTVTFEFTTSFWI